MYRSVKTIHDSMKLLGGRSISTVFSIFYFIFITRLFSKIELSTIPILSVMTGLGAMITGLGLTGACLQKAPELLAGDKKRDAYAMMKSTLVLPSFLSFIVGILALFNSSILSKIFFKSYEFAYLIKIMAIGIMLYQPYSILTHLLRTAQRFGKLSVITVINDVLIRIVALLLYFKYGIGAYLLGLILGQAILILLMLEELKDCLFVKSAFYPLKDFAHYSFPYYMNGFVRYTLIHADQLIIILFLKPEILATYFVARRFLDYLILYSDSLLDPLIPQISKIRREGEQVINRMFKKSSRYLSFAIVPVSFLITAISYPLLQIFGKGKYIEGMPILIILSLSAIFYGIYSLYCVFVYILGVPMDKLKQESFTGVLNIAISLLLVIPLSILGVSIGIILSFLGGILFSRSLLMRLEQVKFDSHALKTTVFSSLLAISVIIGGQLLYYRIYLMPIYILLGIVVYMFVFCKHLNNEDINLIKDFLPVKLKGLGEILYIFGAKKTI